MKKLQKKGHPDWEVTFMRIALDTAKRSHCEWVEVGAVIALMESGRQQVLTTGYNGPPRQIKHCDDQRFGCRRREVGGRKIPGKLCVGAHAEVNAIVNAARTSVSIENGTLFVTLSPCYECAKHILNAGLKEVVYLKNYGDEFPDKKSEAAAAIELIREGGKNCRQFRGELKSAG